MVRPCLRTGFSGAAQQTMMDTQGPQRGAPLGNSQGHKTLLTSIFHTCHLIQSLQGSNNIPIFQLQELRFRVAT